MTPAADAAASPPRRRQGQAHHPLHGADPLTLARVVLAAGRPDRAFLGRFAGIAGASLARSPLTVLEAGVMAARLPFEHRRMAPPIFIIGHWRSGTTHLYNVMVTSERYGYVPPLATGLPWELFSLGMPLRRWLERRMPSDRLIDRVPVTPDSPQEDEIALANMTPFSFYHGIYFPRQAEKLINRGLFFDDCTAADVRAWSRRARHFLAKISLSHRGRPLLIKNPVYTSRIEHLHHIYPGAKFIFLHRNPYDVFLSMRNFFHKLLPWLALQDFSGLDIDRLIVDVYTRMMDEYTRQARALPPEQLVEIGYEALVQHPMETLEQIYARLQLDGFEAAAPAFSSYLQTQQSYRPNQFRGSVADLALVRRSWGQWIDRWGYGEPQLDDLTDPAPR